MLDEPRTPDGSPPPTEGDDSIGLTVPEDFQDENEDDLRSEVDWVECHLGLSDDFFARFLRVEEDSFRHWRLGQAELPLNRQDALRRFEHTVQLLLEDAGMNAQAARTVLEHQVRVEGTGPRRHPHTPPWNGSCMKSYLEDGGPDALPDVERWLEIFLSGGAMFS
jgi:hypothetical protein